jgi:hypothetical protein
LQLSAESADSAAVSASVYFSIFVFCSGSAAMASRDAMAVRRAQLRARAAAARAAHAPVCCGAAA